MTHFDFPYFVEMTPTGIRINHVDYALEGDKVMDADLHIYTVDDKISRGPDYWVWETGIPEFEEWSQRLNKSPDQWEIDDTPQYLRIEGKTYKINDADRSWPLPELYYQFELVGHITTEVDETGATERKIRWA
jgi:hypothetical protein